MKKKALFQAGWSLMLALMMTVPFASQAQDKLVTTVEADLVSAYRWRGQDLGGFSVQPSISLAKYGLSLTGWGSVALDRSGDNFVDELDFSLAYTVGGFAVALTDYFCIPGGFDEAKYFMYNAHRTAHVFEATVGYDFGPVALLWSTNFAGSDYFKNEGVNRSYSSYIEAIAPFRLGGIDFEAELGATPWYGAYNPDGSGFSVVNAALTASKDLNIANFILPASVKIGVNPQTEKVYAVFGLRF